MTTYNWKKNTAYFLASQAISIFGSALVQYAIMWHITLSTKSGVLTTLAIVCGFVPTLLISPFAGVWADRYDCKKLIVLADGGIAVATLALAIVFSLGHDEIWLLLAVMAVRALGSAVQTPCVNAMLPDMVPSDQLTRINGINSSVNSLINLISPIASAALVGFVSMRGIFLIDVLTAAAAVFVMLFFFKLPHGTEKQMNEETVSSTGLKEGFVYIRKEKYLVHFFLFCIAFFFLAAPVSMMTPLQVARTFGGTAWQLPILGIPFTDEMLLSAVEIAFSIGMLLGGLCISVWSGLKNRMHTLVLSGILLGIGTIALGLPIGFGLYMVAMGALGLVLSYFNTTAIVMLQQKVAPAFMGRVFSVMSMLSSSIFPLAMLIFGPLADVVAIEWILLLTGAGQLLVSLLLTRDRPLLKAGETGFRELQAKEKTEAV